MLSGQHQEKAFNTEFTKNTEKVEPKPRAALIAKQFAQKSKVVISSVRSTGSACMVLTSAASSKNHTG
jgi:hypothetical protein